MASPMSSRNETAVKRQQNASKQIKLDNSLFPETLPNTAIEGGGQDLISTGFEKEIAESDIATAGKHNRRDILIGMARTMEPAVDLNDIIYKNI